MAVEWPSAQDLMSARPVTVATDAPLSQALGIMRSRGFHEIPVLRRKNLVGMITLESIARRTNVPLGTKVEHLMVLPPLVTAATPYSELAERLLATGLRAAPVVGRRNELVGLVSRTDLVRAFPELGGLADPRVEEIASPPGVFVGEHDTLESLLRHIRQLEEHPLPVVDRKGRLVGAIGIADLTRALWRPTAPGKRDAARHDVAEHPSMAIEVATLMHAPAVTVPEGTRVSEAARTMVRQKVSSVFVVAEGRPVGVVSQGDLLGLTVGVGPKVARESSDVYVQIHGLRGNGDPEMLAEIDGVVAQGLRRISKHVRPQLLSLHITPHATHRSGDATVQARLHTDRGIFYASGTEWNYFAGIATLMDELGEQVRRAKDDALDRRRAGSFSRKRTVDETVGDAELEAQIRSVEGTPERRRRR